LRRKNTGEKGKLGVMGAKQANSDFEKLAQGGSIARDRHVGRLFVEIMNYRQGIRGHRKERKKSKGPSQRKTHEGTGAIPSEE